MLKPYVTEGCFTTMIWGNITIGLKACLTWALEYGRVSQTAALYIVGLLLYKHSIFTSSSNKFWKRIILITTITAPLLYLLKTTELVSLPIKIALGMWYNLSFMFLLIALFVMFFKTGHLKRLISALQVYGKMSLTNFLFQSIIGTLIFYPYGLHLIDVGVSFSLLIAVLIAVVQIAFSYWWLSKFRQGPLEYLWYKATLLVQ